MNKRHFIILIFSILSFSCSSQKQESSQKKLPKVEIIPGPSIFSASEIKISTNDFNITTDDIHVKSSSQDSYGWNSFTYATEVEGKFYTFLGPKYEEKIIIQGRVILSEINDTIYFQSKDSLYWGGKRSLYLVSNNPDSLSLMNQKENTITFRGSHHSYEEVVLKYDNSILKKTGNNTFSIILNTEEDVTEVIIDILYQTAGKKSMLGKATFKVQ